MNIYTYFTADQMATLIGRAEKGTSALFKHLQAVCKPQDLEDMTFAIADCMPQLVAEDRVYKSGPRKGQRKVLFRNFQLGVDRIVALELTNTAGWKEFMRVNDYCKKSMTETVLTSDCNDVPGAREQYCKHWIRAFLARPDFSHVKEHFRNQTVPNIARTQALVEDWIAKNGADIEEIMTWTGAKYNDWQSANQKAA